MAVPGALAMFVGTKTHLAADPWHAVAPMAETGVQIATRETALSDRMPALTGPENE